MNEDAATRIVVTTVTTLITISGLMITLIWALLDDTGAATVGIFIRAGTAVLAGSILCSLLTLQYIVARSLKGSEKSVADSGFVRTFFLLAWLAFLSGSALVVTAVFKITIDGGAA